MLVRYRQLSQNVCVQFDDEEGNTETYSVHKDLITQASISLIGDIIYDDELVPFLVLDDADKYYCIDGAEIYSQIYEVVIYFIVHRALPDVRITNAKENQDIQTLLMEVWIIAIDYKMPKLQNAAMLKLLQLGSQQATPWDQLQRVTTFLGGMLNYFDCPLDLFVAEQIALAIVKFETAPWDEVRDHLLWDDFQAALMKLLVDHAIFDDRTSFPQWSRYMVDDDNTEDGTYD